MTNINLSKHIGKIAVGSGLIAASIYLLMIKITLAHIETVSGHVPFDMRPLGYDPTEGAALLEALGMEGRAYYLSHQIALDTVYPAMLAVTLIATICWFGQRMGNRKLARFGIAFSVGSALFDYIENLGIAAMIWNWPEVSVPLVYAASTATVLKSALTTLAVLLTLLVGFNWARFSEVDVRQ
ncbi:hypothetical protein [Sulfitobacter donghicola]|uniref:Uncharacterized protein n=1 Tax=Sulfitobacter donghicola DSW-25 = KCTC 12864 = JCM 14565 TaxID=1300350 RepID=A0A073IEW7_9RHOB|nr:hypothetical protein [Sulfitobacter donghicola]KEJ88314.1 hypothetical protein DSW25_16695 [Sulfitobacter donghicola DSW-25 = KCTC 12864 = JCM 14565]KIN68910.1 putative integron gene cassette protein [Sulfitobacter donghicola DSW-25 = KCTC 12864 = JCM 14565]